MIKQIYREKYKIQTPLNHHILQNKAVLIQTIKNKLKINKII